MCVQYQVGIYFVSDGDRKCLSHINISQNGYYILRRGQSGTYLFRKRVLRKAGGDIFFIKVLEIVEIEIMETHRRRRSSWKPVVLIFVFVGIKLCKRPLDFQDKEIQSGASLSVSRLKHYCFIVLPEYTTADRVRMLSRCPVRFALVCFAFAFAFLLLLMVVVDGCCCWLLLLIRLTRREWRPRTNAHADLRWAGALAAVDRELRAPKWETRGGWWSRPSRPTATTTRKARR